jgi:hypothetical protein
MAQQTVYITHRQTALLKDLNARTRVPVAEYIREGLDLVLAKYTVVATTAEPAPSSAGDATEQP